MLWFSYFKENIQPQRVWLGIVITKLYSIEVLPKIYLFKINSFNSEEFGYKY